jgi:hypothetical protein
MKERFDQTPYNELRSGNAEIREENLQMITRATQLIHQNVQRGRHYCIKVILREEGLV